jgi:cobalt-zinc-cadmium efflux system membrane fusion protein
MGWTKMRAQISKGCAVVCFAVVLALCVPACESEDEALHGQESHSDRQEVAERDDHEGEQAVRLSEAQMAEFGIAIERAGPGSIEKLVELPGEVQPNADRLAHLVPRFEGIVTRVHKRVGDSVAKGDVLAIIESSESLAPYELKTLIAGTVIARHITRGEAVARESEAFVVADLGTVWVDFSIYQRDLTRVSVGQPVAISAGRGLAEAVGNISYITPIVDEATRTATARVVLPNPDGSWMPGMFATGIVTIETAQVKVAVLHSAVQTVAQNTIVFVAAEDGLEPRSVIIGRRDRDRIEILDGLGPGDRYVSQGSFILKSELEKEGFEVGHGH